MESPESLEKPSIEQLIAGARTFEELYGILMEADKAGTPLKGETSSKIILDISDLRTTMKTAIPVSKDKLFGDNSPQILRMITRTGGLRGKVAELLEEEYRQRQNLQ